MRVSDVAGNARPMTDTVLLHGDLEGLIDFFADTRAVIGYGKMAIVYPFTPYLHVADDIIGMGGNWTTKLWITEPSGVPSLFSGKIRRKGVICVV
tara:strand:+ start:174 stop:458 length:285 start_codon:yes stop_codon:yes gene_type:complete